MSAKPPTDISLAQLMQEARPVDADPPRGSLDALHARQRADREGDTVTLLGATGDAIATKIHRPDGNGWDTTSYDHLYHCRVREREVCSIYDLADLLDDLENCPQWTIIRGDPTGAAPCSLLDDEPLVRRNSNEKSGESCDHDGDCSPHFESAEPGRRWMMLDIDDLAVDDIPGACPTDTPDQQTLDEWRWGLINQLPPFLWDATHYYQWSASAGLEGWDELSLHLWYWLDRPVYDDSLRKFWREYRDESGIPVDTALFNPVQIHYTAAPIFQGADDPLGEPRSGLAHHEKHSVWPPSEILDAESWHKQEQQRQQQRERRQERAREARRYTSDARTETARQQYAQTALDDACQTIASTPKGQRDPTLIDEAFAIGTIVGADALDQHTAESALVDAGESAGLPTDEVEDKVGRALKAGTNEPRDLSHVGTDDYTPSGAPSADQTGTSSSSKRGDDVPDDQETKNKPNPDDNEDNTPDFLQSITEGGNTL